jgi:hypothetical protein
MGQLLAVVVQPTPPPVTETVKVPPPPDQLTLAELPIVWPELGVVMVMGLLEV